MRLQPRVSQEKRRKSQWQLAFAVLAALVGPVGQIASTVHEASVRHVICAEHGEISHAALLLASGAPASGPAVQGRAPGDEHEHCPEAGLLSRAPSLPAVNEGVMPQVKATAPRGEPARYVTAGTRLLLSAPKTSPPSA